MITIEIIDKIRRTDDEIGQDLWVCWLEITNGIDTYIVTATAPFNTPDLQVYFEAQETAIWSVAEESNIIPDSVFSKIQDTAIKAYALVVLDEINILRTEAGLVTRTTEQLRQAIKSKLQSL